MRGEGFAATVAYVQYIHRIALDREENPIHVGFAAVKELPHFKRKAQSLWSQGAAFWKPVERRYGLFQGDKPPNARLSGLLGY